MPTAADYLEQAFSNPLVGRDGDEPLHWTQGPWSYGLSFNR
jgi:hypothetical protein